MRLQQSFQCLEKENSMSQEYILGVTGLPWIEKESIYIHGMPA